VTVYLLVLALAAEEVEEVDDDAGHHQNLQVVVLPVGSLKDKSSLKASTFYETRQSWKFSRSWGYS